MNLGSAEISLDGLYRYTLQRRWAVGRGSVTWLMFNPSTADAAIDDATIRKCVGFSKRWGYGHMSVVNLYALRSRDPKAVLRAGDPVGPSNDDWLKTIFSGSHQLICAWGCTQHAPNIGQRVSVALMLAAWCALPVLCLGRRKDGHPRHPLMLPYTTLRTAFTWRSL
jgi:hypothetical protein